MSRLIYPKSSRRELSAWRVMRRRCLEPGFKDYPRYGGAGIEIHKPWVASFLTFLQDMGPAPSQSHWLGRRDVTKGYTPDNCLWTQHAPQMRRRAFCHKVSLNLQQVTIAEAARAIRMEDSKLRRRLLVCKLPLNSAVSHEPMVNKGWRLVTHLGITLPLVDWAAASGVSKKALWWRLRAGWPPALALDPTPRGGGQALRELKAAKARARAE